MPPEAPRTGRIAWGFSARGRSRFAASTLTASARGCALAVLAVLAVLAMGAGAGCIRTGVWTPPVPAESGRPAVDRVAARDKMIDSLKAEKNDLLRLNKEATDKFLLAETQRQVAEAKVEEMNLELKRRHDTIDTLHKVILKQQQALKVTEINRRNAETQKNEMVNGINKVRQRLDDVLKEKTRVEKDLHHYTWMIEKVLEHGIPVADIVFGGGDGTPAAAIPSRVLSVRNDVNLVMLSVGKSDGVQKGHRFTVYRGDQYIGKVEVESLFDDMCSARILPDWTKQEIKEGDTANTRVY